MQPALTPDVLLAIAAGVAVLVVVAIVVLTVRRRRRRALAAEPARAAASPDPARGEGTPTWREPAAVERAGSGRTVAAAVAQALAAREARADATAHPGGRGDARDRLLAVLLDDPVRAVGATVELESCRRQLDRLTGAVQHERATLRAVLARLSAAGLAPDQLARLSGLPDDELATLLRESATV
ncbi:hypothetical protein [Pseudonocardia sp.]|uniref:hypothetical protein n=1 Tax=Pseudonocardia sp. TaxID=60912 RepID=UPI00261CE9C4|nr:hypothetical protein [Pseudonocardia sp.]